MFLQERQLDFDKKRLIETFYTTSARGHQHNCIFVVAWLLGVVCGSINV